MPFWLSDSQVCSNVGEGACKSSDLEGKQIYWQVGMAGSAGTKSRMREVTSLPETGTPRRGRLPAAVGLGRARR